MDINSLRGEQIVSSLPTDPTFAPAASGGGSGVQFNHLVSQFVNSVNGDQAGTDASLQQLISGNSNNVYDVVLNAANAELSFQFLLEVRNKLLEAHQELMRMPI